MGTDRYLTIPNMLTYLRMGLIPVFVVLFFLPFPYQREILTGLFIIAGLTDLLDGILARRLKQFTRFGAFLDPVADKLMVATALVLLVYDYHNILMTIAGVVIVLREITISALREWMAQVGKHAAVKVSILGKVKTVIQFVAICVLLSQPAGMSWVTVSGFILIYVAVAMTLWSMFWYLEAAYKVLKQQPVGGDTTQEQK